MAASFLRRGMAAGLLAGLLAGLFALFVGEPLLDEAVRLEEAASSGVERRPAGHEESASLVRPVQRVGLFFAMGLFGVTVGGLFGLAYARFRRRLAPASEWGRSLTLAGGAFVGLSLAPFLKYPANPPALGDPSTIGERTSAHFAMVALSLLVVFSAWRAAQAMEARGVGAPVRQLCAGLGASAAFGVLFVAMPAAPDPGAFPAGLLWDFRLSSLGTLTVFWAGLGAAFGLLCERAAEKGGT